MPPPFDGYLTFGFTRDLDATARFYEGILGLPLALDQGSCRIWKACAGGYIGFCDREQPEREGVILTLLSDDVEGWQTRLEAHGVAIEKPAQENATYGIVHLFCRDPNGYLVEIQRFLDPAWDGSAAASPPTTP